MKGFDNFFCTECQRLKAQVVQEIRSNQQLEQDVRIMDIKIGLLVKNRISLEDVVTHSTQIKKERRKGGASVSATGDSSALLHTGGLTKANQQRLEVNAGEGLLMVSWIIFLLFILYQKLSSTPNVS